MDATTTAALQLSRKQVRRVLDRYRVSSGKGFRLKTSTLPTRRDIC